MAEDSSIEYRIWKLEQHLEDAKAERFVWLSKSSQRRKMAKIIVDVIERQLEELRGSAKCSDTL